MATLVQRDLDFDRQAQSANLARVTGKLATHIRHFVALHPEWHMSELVAYVEGIGERVAPASCDRVLRALRQSGELNYRVLNRRASHYQRVEVTKQTRAALYHEREA